MRFLPRIASFFLGLVVIACSIPNTQIMHDILSDTQIGFPLEVRDQYINILNYSVSSLRQIDGSGFFLSEGKEICVAAYVPKGKSLTVVIAGDMGYSDSEGNGGWDFSLTTAGDLSENFSQDEYYDCGLLKAIGDECFMPVLNSTCLTYKIIIEYYYEYPGEPYLTRYINLET